MPTYCTYTQHIIEKCQEYQTSITISFINFSKAFDSIHWPSLWRVLLSYAVPEKVVKPIECIYDNSHCCVRTKDSFSSQFQVITGVWLGFLSLVLFAVAINWALKGATIDQSINCYLWSKLSDLDFSDDIAALLDSNQGLQWLVSAISKVTGGLDLSISDKKTKFMLSGNPQPPNVILIGWKKVEIIKDFTYLGNSINNQGTVDHEISCGIAEACATFNQLNKIWSTKKFTLKSKFCFYNSCVLSSLLYSCETWYLKTSQEKKFDTFNTRCIRKILNIKSTLQCPVWYAVGKWTGWAMLHDSPPQDLPIKCCGGSQREEGADAGRRWTSTRPSNATCTRLAGAGMKRWWWQLTGPTGGHWLPHTLNKAGATKSK